MPGDNQYIDPNDPNLDSQRTTDQSDPASQLRNTQGLNSLVKGDPVLAAWLAQHPGALSSPSGQQQYAALVGQRYHVDPSKISVNPAGQLTVQKADNSFWKDLAIGSVITLGPIAATFLPGLFGASAAESGAGFDTVGDAWAAGQSGATAATTAVTGAGVAGTGATSSGITNWLTSPGVIPAVTNVAGQIVGASIQSAAQGNATAAQVKAAQDALDFEKQKYGQVLLNASPYVSTGLSANDRMAQLLGLPSAPRGRVGPSGTGVPGVTDITSPPGTIQGQGPYTVDQLRQMATAKGITPGSPNDLLLKKYGIPNPLDGTDWQHSGGSPVQGATTPMTSGGNPYGQSMSGGTPMSQVTLKAPDGSTKTFAPNDPLLAHYKQLPGVSVVNG